MKRHSFMICRSLLSRSLVSRAMNRSFRHSLRSLLVVAFLLALISFPAVVAQSGTEVLESAKSDLMCVCGCPHQLGQCGDECGVAPRLIGEIQTLLNEGAGQQEVYSEFEARYGAMVYAAPKAEGFNLIGWLLPFVGLTFGAVLVWGVVRKLKVDAESPVGSSDAPVGEIDEKYRQMLQKELTE